jgi:hypothetical protein
LACSDTCWTVSQPISHSDGETYLFRVAHAVVVRRTGDRDVIVGAVFVDLAGTDRVARRAGVGGGERGLSGVNIRRLPRRGARADLVLNSRRAVPLDVDCDVDVGGGGRRGGKGAGSEANDSESDESAELHVKLVGGPGQVLGERREEPPFIRWQGEPAVEVARTWLTRRAPPPDAVALHDDVNYGGVESIVVT